MSLRYSFRHLFFGGKLNKQRLYNILEDLDKASGGEATEIGELETAVGNIESAIGDESTEGTILARIKALEDAE